MTVIHRTVYWAAGPGIVPPSWVELQHLHFVGGGWGLFNSDGLTVLDDKIEKTIGISA